jgi:hypothetical protein
MSLNHLFPLQKCSKWRIWRLHDKTKLSYFEDWYVVVVVVSVVVLAVVVVVAAVVLAIVVIVVVVVPAVVARIKWLFVLWMIAGHFKQIQTCKMMLF